MSEFIQLAWTASANETIVYDVYRMKQLFVKLTEHQIAYIEEIWVRNANANRAITIMWDPEEFVSTATTNSSDPPLGGIPDENSIPFKYTLTDQWQQVLGTLGIAPRHLIKLINDGNTNAWKIIIKYQPIDGEFILSPEWIENWSDISILTPQISAGQPFYIAGDKSRLDGPSPEV